MKYKAVKEILPREQENDLKEILSHFSYLIDDAINFGTHLVKWEMNKEREGDEHMPPLLFFRNILELGDAVSTLIKNSSIDACKPILRSLLENLFSLEYLLEKNTPKRALSYIVWHTHKKLNLGKRLTSSTTNGNQLKKEITKDKLLGKTAETFFDHKMILAAKKNSENLLKLPKYISIENEYQRTLQNRKNPNWYSLYQGPNNIEQLAKYLELHALYEFIYRGLSGYVHSTNILDGKLVPNKNGSVDIIQIRYPKDAQSITQHTINFLLMAFKAFCNARLPKKKQDYNNWYMEIRKSHNKLLEKKYINIVF